MSRLPSSSRALIVAGALFGAMALARPATASPILLDTGLGTDVTGRAAGSGPGQGIAVSVDTQLTDIGFYLDMPNGGTARFMIWDDTNTNLLSQTDVAVGAGGSPVLTLAHLGSPFALNAGSTYFFGVIGDNSLDVSFIFPTVSLSQNGLSLIQTGNSNYSTFATPSFAGFGGAEIALQLDGAQAGTVPEPGSLALVVTGLGLLTRRFVGRRRRT
jgi:PEP-CTERM motif